MIKVVPGPKLPKRENLHQAWMTFHIAKARTALDADFIIDQLASDVVYESQNAIDAIQGKEAVADYLRRRFDFLRDLRTRQNIGEFLPGYVDIPKAKRHPCIIFRDEHYRQQAVWLLTLNEDNQITRIDICTIIPDPETAVRLSP